MERGADADLSPGAPLTMMKSRLGMVLTGLIHAGSIREDEAGYLQLERAQDIEFAPAAIRAFITRTLEERGLLGKQELYRLAEIHFGTDRTATKQDDNALRSVMGRCLVEMEKERAVVKTTQGLPAGRTRRLSGDGARRVSWQAAEGGDLKRCFLEAIHTKGGEWFESYCVRLLRAYYLSEGKLVDEGFVTGGSDDGGIGSIIHATDDLGYRETVLMQMKNRHAVMTAKDVREFYGAVCAENGSRGIFITLSSFHPEAQKLLDKVDNLTGVNGDKLFEIARRCKLGLLEKNGRLCIDEALLLNT
ncbi:MAG: restriction endonuclease [Oscillospiraceae bacterium]